MYEDEEKLDKLST